MGKNDGGFTPLLKKVTKVWSLIFRRNATNSKSNSMPFYGLKSPKSSSRAGFTLIEIMVVVSITILLTSLAIGFNRSSQKQLIVYRDQALIVGFLNRAKALAIEKFKAPSVDFETCAFGLHFDGDSRDFVLFQDLGVGGLGGCDATNYRYDSGGITSGSFTEPERLEILSLDDRLEFVGIPSEGLDVLFVPPELDMISSAASFPVSITIQTADGEISVTIIVSASGQVSTN